MRVRDGHVGGRSGVMGEHGSESDWESVREGGREGLKKRRRAVGKGQLTNQR